MGLLNCVWTLIYPVASHLLLLPWLDGQEEKKLIFIVWYLLLELFLILWNISLSGINSEHLPGLTKSPTKAWKSILMALWICVDECAECQSNRMMVSFNWLWKISINIVRPWDCWNFMPRCNDFEMGVRSIHVKQYNLVSLQNLLIFPRWLSRSQRSAPLELYIASSCCARSGNRFSITRSWGRG